MYRKNYERQKTDPAITCPILSFWKEVLCGTTNF